MIKKLLLFAAGATGMVVLFLAGLWFRPLRADSTGNLLTNSGFEDGGSSPLKGWSLEKKAADKGSVSVTQEHSHAGRAVKLVPNPKNGNAIGNAPLAVGQGFPSANFLGKQVYVSGWLGAEGGATAVIGVYALHSNGSVRYAEVKRSGSPDLEFRQDSLKIPNDKSILFVIVNCHVEGQAGAAYFDDVALSFDPPAAVTASPVSSRGPAPLTAPGRALSASAVIDAGKDVRRIPDSIYGTNVEWIWAGNELWNEKAKQFDTDFLNLIRDLGVAQIRFPGGIMADFYHWKDGIGPQESRKTTESAPGGARSLHSFGTDEALALSKATNAPFLITANIVTGTPQEAADWLRYINSRAAAGAGPKAVHWELGNEQYHKDNARQVKASTMTPAEYIRRYRSFASALRAADPDVKIGAISDDNYSPDIPHSYPTWTQDILQQLGTDMDFLAVHNGYAPAVFNPGSRSMREIYEALMAAPVLIERELADLSRRLDRAGKNRSTPVKLAVTEWGPFFHLSPDSPYVDHAKTLGSALYVASMLRVYASSPRVEMADFFKIGDKLFLGMIGQRENRWTPKPSYYAFQMFRRHFGDTLVASSMQSPEYDSKSAGWVTAVASVPYVEIAAARSSDNRKLYIMAINKNFDSDIPLALSLRNAKPSANGTVWTLSGSSLDANTGTELFQAPGINWARQAEDPRNPRFTRGGPNEVGIKSEVLRNVGVQFSHTLPKASVTALEIDLQ